MQFLENGIIYTRLDYTRKTTTAARDIGSFYSQVSLEECTSSLASESLKSEVGRVLCALKAYTCARYLFDPPTPNQRSLEILVLASILLRRSEDEILIHYESVSESTNHHDKPPRMRCYR